MGREQLFSHLAAGETTTCRAWALTRRDGQVFGFTDHDLPLAFDGIAFSASSGMSASALEQSTGLAVDNSETIGALSDAAITEADILAGRFDGAEIRCWQLDWSDPEARVEIFRGSIGGIMRANGQFQAELRGLSEALNKTQGKVFHRRCSAVLGDSRCRFETATAGYRIEAVIEASPGRGEFVLAPSETFAAGWFDGGRVTVLDGGAAGLSAMVRADLLDGARHRILLWEEIPAPIAVGDRLRLEAGCDRRAATCRDKFAILLNFRGFPHIPGDDWLTAYPRDGQAHDGSGWTG